MSILQSQLVLNNGKIIKNRLAKSAMSEQLSGYGYPDTPYHTLYQTWADGGAGLIITGNVMIDKTALGSANDLVLDDDTHLPMFEMWSKNAKQHSTTVLIQLNHPGKQSPKDLSKTPVAPSPLPLTGKMAKFFNPPRQLTTQEVYGIIDKFVYSTKLAYKAGFDGVQIHCAHGYLLSQFLSAHHNRRTDEFGGSLTNRTRILSQIIQQIKACVPSDFIISVKLNSSDFQTNLDGQITGFDTNESLQVCQMLDELGVHLLEISGGNYENPVMMGDNIKASTRAREAYFLQFARQAREICQIPLMVTGGFRSKSVMEQAILDNACDIIGLAKPLAILPDLPNRLFANQFETISTPAPKTGIDKIDNALSGVIQMGYYMHQLKQLSQHKNPKTDYPAFLVLKDITQSTAINTFNHFKKRFKNSQF